MATVQKITPNLWFDKNGEEAARYYCSIFKDSSVGHISYYGKAGFEQHQMPEGTAMVVEFTLAGQSFLALNGGPIFKFSEAVSFVVNCDDQQEVDHYWEKLSAGGDENAQMCGWLKDKFGLSWQIVPKRMSELYASGNAEKSGRMMKAMMQMKKLDIKKLEEAYEGNS